MSMEERAVRGVPWTFLSFGATKIITLAATIVLARLLDPADFGLMALAMLAFGFIGLLRDLGLGSTLVLRQDFDERAEGTVITLMLASAVVVAVIVSATAPLVAYVLGEDRLTTLLPALASTTVLGAVAWFYESLLQRDLEFRKRFVAQLAQSLAFAVTAIALAVAGLGVWALVLGQVAAMAAWAGSYLVLVDRRVRPAFDRRIARETLSTGKGFLAQGGLAWVNQNVDYLIVGRALGTAPLGYYSMAYRLSELTNFGIADPVAKVTFPSFAKSRQEGRDISRAYLGALRLVALAVLAVGALLSATADPFTRAVFGEEWVPMIAAISVLGVWAAVKPIEATAIWLLNSIGEAWAAGKLTAILLVTTVPFLILAAQDGIAAIAWVVLGQTCVSLAVVVVLAGRRVGIGPAAHWRVLRPVVIAAAASWLVARLIVELLAEAPSGAALAAGLAAGGVTYVLVASLVQPGTVAFVFRQGARAFGRTAEPV
jgi:lipopolysaccharide exporter